MRGDKRTRIRQGEKIVTAEYTFGMFGRDVSREATGFQFYTGAFHDPNGVDALVSALETALTGISELQTVREEGTSILKTGSDYEAGLGNREDKILITFSDNVTHSTGTVTVPCRLPNATLPTMPNSDLYDITDATGPWPAFVSAFEAIARSKAGNAITVLTARKVGRNI